MGIFTLVNAVVSFDEHRLKELFSAFHGKKIAVVGDLMVDRYFWGTVTRISPEAPVPVVEVESESFRLGGAANVGSNIRALGGDPMVVGLVGADHSGRELVDMLGEQKFSTDGVLVDPSRPTTVKTRVIAHDQHVVRIDSESKRDCSDELGRQIVDIVNRAIGDLDGIIIEDYNKGVVTRDVIRGLIEVANRHGRVVTVDPKFNNFFEYRDVTVFKPNRREVEEVLGGKLRSAEDVVRAGTKLIDELSARNVLITRGEDGMSLFEKNGEVTHMKTLAGSVVDVSGAGDTVISTLTMALAAGGTIKEASVLANCAGGLVVGSVGIVPVDPARLIEATLRYSRNSRGS